MKKLKKKFDLRWKKSERHTFWMKNVKKEAVEKKLFPCFAEISAKFRFDLKIY